jgi:hypothetical protein
MRRGASRSKGTPRWSFCADESLQALVPLEGRSSSFGSSLANQGLRKHARPRAPALGRGRRAGEALQSEAGSGRERHFSGRGLAGRSGRARQGTAALWLGGRAEPCNGRPTTAMGATPPATALAGRVGQTRRNAAKEGRPGQERGRNRKSDDRRRFRAQIRCRVLYRTRSPRKTWDW